VIPFVHLLDMVVALVLKTGGDDVAQGPVLGVKQERIASGHGPRRDTPPPERDNVLLDMMDST
jgi:hypothetical protein